MTGRPILDLVGHRYGSLVVLERAPGPDVHHPRWRCRCDCGIEEVVRGDKLAARRPCNRKRHRARHAGLMKPRRPKIARAGGGSSIDRLPQDRVGRLPRVLDGQRFGMLRVERYAGQHRTAPKKEGSSVRYLDLWWCQCDCGSPMIAVREDRLRSIRADEATRSCGCMRLSVVRRGRPTLRQVAAREAEKAGRGAEVAARRRTMALWAPWKRMLDEAMRARSVPVVLMLARWPFPKATLPGLLEELPRLPTLEEARALALILNLRGGERAAFEGAARDAREALAAYQAGVAQVVERVREANREAA